MVISNDHIVSRVRGYRPLHRWRHSCSRWINLQCEANHRSPTRVLQRITGFFSRACERRSREHHAVLRKVSVSVGRMLIFWNCCNNLSNIIRDSILEDFFVRFVFSLQMASDGLCCGRRGNYSMSVLLWTLIRTRELSADCSLHTGAARKHRSTTTLWTRKYILVPPLRKPNPSELESHTAYIEWSDAIVVGNMGHGLLFSLQYKQAKCGLWTTEQAKCGA